VLRAQLRIYVQRVCGAVKRQAVIAPWAERQKKARLGGAGLGKGGNLGLVSSYLFFLAFFFAAIGRISFVGINGMRAMAKI
jgi:hypothetical protein